MSKIVDGATALELLAEVVAESGRSTVAVCRYVDEVDGPGEEEFILTAHCIAGRVFDKIGVPMVYLLDSEGIQADEVARRFSRDNPDVVTFTLQGRDLINEAQILQDGGLPWGQVIDQLNNRFADEIEGGA